MPRMASVMDIDGSESLPPSSSNPLQNDSAARSRTGTKSTRTRTANPMALGDEDGTDAMEEDGVAGRRGPEAEEDGAAHQNRRRRPKGQMNMDVPPVRDATGEKVMESFELFLKAYTENITLPATPGGSDMDGVGAQQSELIYIEQVKAMRDYELTTLYVDFGHLLERDDVLARAISDQYYRFLPYLRRALLNLVRQYDPAYLYVNSTSSATTNAGLQTREFNIAFHHLPLVSGIRELRTERIGTLLSISGTVTRTSEVRPELIFGTFLCEECGGNIPEVEQQFKYTEPNLCPNPLCGNRTQWKLSIDDSKFTDWQKVRIQENPNEIPTGSMPRSLDVILRGELVERAKAGDKCVFTGTFIVVPDVSQLGLPGVNAEMQREARGAGQGTVQGVTGLKSLGVRDLQYKTAFLACMVNDADGRVGGTNIRGDEEEDDEGEAFANSLTQQELDELKAMIHSDYIYARLVASIAPTVYGHDIIKKGLLLQLMGGVHKQTPEGMHLRGDINICIVGDPSTSKSQFLKYICSFLPRAVYTSGKASSAAGLTAAVVKDEETGEFTIEAGALMLADNGICAIDEFDKMDLSDQVAIHEAMEQQTISIAKAGIQATLNARTSILAAANPVGGRYNRKASLRVNVAMSAPIMSRFDLFFVVLDECDENTDLKLARHIVNVHRLRDEAIKPEFSTEALQRYIRYARTFNPKFTPEAADVLVEKYRILRQDDASGTGKNSYRITVRQLESMIRLSEAIARANCTNEVIPSFVREAYSLLRQSIIHVEKDDIDFDEEELQDEKSKDRRGEDDIDMDTQLTAEELAQLEAAENSMSATGLGTLSASATITSPSRAGGKATLLAQSSPARHQRSVPAPPPSDAPLKRRMKITHDKYMTLQSLIVLHLSEHERNTAQGIEREDLIDWYLETKENDVANIEELEYEKELIGKVLSKLVKDNYLIAMSSEVMESLPSENDEPSQDTVISTRRVMYMVHPSVDTSSSVS